MSPVYQFAKKSNNRAQHSPEYTGKAKRVNTIISATDDGYCQIINETISLERPFKKPPRTPDPYSAQFVSTSQCSTGRGNARRSSSQIQLWPSECPQTADKCHLILSAPSVACSAVSESIQLRQTRIWRSGWPPDHQNFTTIRYIRS